MVGILVRASVHLDNLYQATSYSASLNPVLSWDKNVIDNHHMDENLIKANCIHPIQINCFILCQFHAIVHTVVCKNEPVCIYKSYTY